MRKVLILSYFSPPGNFAGSYRVKSWLDYFHLFGYYPILMTRHWNENETDFSGKSKVKDKTIEVKQNAEIHYLPYKGDLKTRFLKFSKNKFMFLGKFLGFLEIFLQNYFVSICSYKNIYQEAREVLLKNPDINLLIATGRPFLLFRFANLLKDEFPYINWIADYRDPWTTNEINKTNLKQSFFSFFEKRLEKKWLKNALLFSTCSQTWIDQISAFIQKEGFEVRNGYNDDYFFRQKTSKPNEIFTIIYNGTLYPNQPIEVFLEGFLKFCIKSPSVKTRVIFVGSALYFENQNRLKPFIEKTTGKIELAPRLKQEAFFEFLEEANACLLTNYCGEKGRHTAKLYDYLASGKPIILCPSDNDVMASLINETKTGYIVNSAEEVDKLLCDLYFNWERKVDSSFSPDLSEIKKYSRKNQVKIFCNKLNMIISDPFS